jgi:CelD/BcsL family acetyltransferase involved in cellulose biosynthesis
MKTTILTNTTDFDALSSEWDELLERVVNAPFFMRYLYQRTWWQHLGEGDLALITVRNDEEQLVGLVPLYDQTGQRELTLLGHVEVSDYLDLLIDPAHLEATYNAILDCLNDMKWDKIYLCSLPHNSITHTKFAEFVQQRGWRVVVSQQDVCPVISLADSWDGYLATIDKKQRHEIRRKIGKINREASPVQYVVDSEDGLMEAMNDFIDLHQKSAPHKEDFWRDELIQFFRSLAQNIAKQGWLKLYFLELDGIRVASMLCFDYDNQFLLYNSGYDPAYSNLSVGNVLTSYTIQAAIELGRTRYDFLRGDEIYKFRFGAVSEPVYDMEIYRDN